MCHGSAPSEISLADNARLCRGFYESVSTLEGGGASLVDAFLHRFKGYDIELTCHDEIASLEDVRDKRVGRFILSSGAEVEADTCVFTINPKSIIELLPKNAFPPAFFSRVNAFDCTPGFFTLFALLDE